MLNINNVKITPLSYKYSFLLCDCSFIILLHYFAFTSSLTINVNLILHHHHPTALVPFEI